MNGRRLRRIAVRLAGLLAVGLGLAVLLTGYATKTLDDDLLLTDRVRAEDVQRGEIHYLGTPPATDHAFLERVMALAGDRITCRAGRFTLNGRPVDGTCPRDVDVTVPPGKAFVDDLQGTATVDLTQLGERVVWHTGTEVRTPPLPGKLTGAIVLIILGPLLVLAHRIAALATAVSSSRTEKASHEAS
ncbi:S26 family signal peptidase [Streptomyces sp. SP17BM10]|uniref:S26 family signal peptidase n=1 Tax=Streptomyces sp. SP17BM10 TaxID=3002530 RepID=UPI002E7A5853|nr:S26 family signal peptidase [Streptomyces sp. SP17BM10]MEE1782561.1 S26 family signal peptidase [Streptomyces sp. SP17BM10]